MNTTRSGIPIAPFYSERGGAGETPGVFPYTRGRASTPHQVGKWIQRELSGEGDPDNSNAQVRYLLAHGQTGIDVIGDSPTQSMLDPDHPLARASVGTQGVSLCRGLDYVELFRGVKLDEISVSSSVPPIMALSGLVVAARASGCPLDKLRGSILQGPLYTEDCCYAMFLPVAFRVRLALDCMAFCAQFMRRFHCYIEDTYFISESGLSPVEEMALGFVQIRHLVRKLCARGVPVDSFAPRIAILVNCGMDLFEEVAKIRATRRIYARMMRDEFGAQDSRSCSVAITSHTSGLSLTAQQPANNIARGTIQALALALAGVQAMEISAFDEAYRTPSKEAHLVGLRTQQIIELESGVANVTDPLGGSYFVEALTDEMEARILKRVREIERENDPETLSETGYFKEIFQNAMAESQRRIDSGELSIVGLNAHRIADEDDRLLREVTDGKITPWTKHIQRIEEFRRSRNLAGVRAALANIAKAVPTEENMVPLVIAAFDADATVGEILGTMRRALGLTWDPLVGGTPEFLEGIGCAA